MGLAGVELGAGAALRPRRDCTHGTLGSVGVRVGPIDGKEFDDLPQARRYALSLVRQVVATELRRDGLSCVAGRVLAIRDERGRVVDRISFREALADRTQ
jgi:hypothetical protein